VTLLVRMRISLADRPGALAQVGLVMADHGGNIVSVDVHQAGVVSAIDDLLVEFPDDADLAALRNDLTASGVATVLSHQEAQREDPIVATLRRVTEMVATQGVDSDELLARGVADLCSSPVAWVTSSEESTRWEAGRYAKERGGAIALRTTELPSHLADRLPGEVWLLAVPDPEMRAGGRTVFVARQLAAEFTSTEIARIEALMALHDQLEHLMDWA